MVRPRRDNVNRGPVAQVLVERVFTDGERTVALVLKLLLAVSASAVDGVPHARLVAMET